MISSVSGPTAEDAEVAVPDIAGWTLYQAARLGLALAQGPPRASVCGAPTALRPGVFPLS